MDKERQKMTKRRTNMYIMDRYGYGMSTGAGKKSGPMSAFASRSRSGSQRGDRDLVVPLVSVVDEEVEEIADSYPFVQKLQNR